MAAILPLIPESVTQHDIAASLDVDHHIESHVHSAMSGGGYTGGIDVKAITLDRIKEAAQNDSETQALIKVILEGFPNTKAELPEMLQPYWNIRSDLSCMQGVALYHNRIIVPQCLRSEVLESFHAAHQGVV